MKKVYIKVLAIFVLCVVLTIYAVQIMQFKHEIQYDTQVVSLGNKLLEDKKNSLLNKIKNLTKYTEVFAKSMEGDEVRNLILKLKDKYDEIYDFHIDVIPDQTINCMNSDGKKCLLHVKFDISFIYTNYEQAVGLVEELGAIRDVAIETISLNHLEANKAASHLVLNSYHK